MTAFVKPGTREEVGVITDFVDPQYGLLIILTLVHLMINHSLFSVVKFVQQLIDAYLDIPWVETKCGYACSDQYVIRISSLPWSHRLTTALPGPKTATRLPLLLVGHHIRISIGLETDITPRL